MPMTAPQNVPGTWGVRALFAIASDSNISNKDEKGSTTNKKPRLFLIDYTNYYPAQAYPITQLTIDAEHSFPVLVPDPNQTMPEAERLSDKEYKAKPEGKELYLLGPGEIATVFNNSYKLNTFA
jgi:hypothetical protein